MNVWELGPQFVQGGKSAFAMLRTTNGSDARVLREHFGGEAWGGSWHPPLLVRNPVNKDEAASQELGDLSMIDAYGSILAFSERALDALLPHISAYGQVLPVRFDESPCAIFNVTRVIDALDEAASEVKYFEDGGVMRIAKFVFKPEAVKDEWIFKIPQRPSAHNFVTDRFVQLVRNAGLRGFEFKKRWSDEVQQRATA